LVRIDNVAGLPALIIEPETTLAPSPVLLFLHGKGEAGSSANEIPMVCVHQTPPFQAILGRLPGAIVIAPQAPPLPNKDDWNWAEHVMGLAGFLRMDRFAGCRFVATGFSRGGLGVLQLVSAFPSLVSRWAVVDPQPARNDEEASAILNSPATSDRGWVRYGVSRTRNEAWRKFSSDLAAKIPLENYAVTELSHTEMALAAYGGSALSNSRNNLYEFLNLEFRKPDELAEA
jgi:pimeloyl-ACP methyl ester carboxylesterase